MSDYPPIEAFKALVSKCLNGSITTSELKNGAMKLQVVLDPNDDLRFSLTEFISIIFL